MALSPKAQYLRDLERPGFVADSAQAAAVDALDGLYKRLLARQAGNQQPLARVRRWLGSSLPPENGLYLWGGVGRGKTYLMDVFYEALPFNNKMRTHFHRFMRRVHQELAALKGQKNPLNLVAQLLADEACVICFDEFFVTDITDAMLLGMLLDALFARGVCLVATSNIAPAGLYANGLQREKFLPAIALLNRHTQVLNVDGGTDYRLRVLRQAALYFHPLTPATAEQMVAHFQRLSGAGARENPTLIIEGRGIQAIKEWDDVVWFDFAALCDGPRSQRDYIVLAKEYHTVLLSDVPQFTPSADDQARRFVYLVDEFYDRSVKLIISAAAPIEALYAGGNLSFEFERTQSRLLEMQSQDYLASPHKP
jgi:cell division protein ZapE